MTKEEDFLALVHSERYQKYSSEILQNLRDELLKTCNETGDLTGYVKASTQNAEYINEILYEKAGIELGYKFEFFHQNPQVVDEAKRLIEFITYEKKKKKKNISKIELFQLNMYLPIIADETLEIELRKDAALSVNFFDINSKIAYCNWAYYAAMNSKLITKEIWSAILIDAHQEGRIHSFLSHFKLGTRVKMFELAEPKHLMTDTEYQYFLSLPDELKIYRGGSGMTANKLKHGMCWTTSIEVAAWFANRDRYKGLPIVIEAIVKRGNIFAVLEGSEKEVVIRGGRVSKLKVCHVDIDQLSSGYKR